MSDNAKSVVKGALGRLADYIFVDEYHRVNAEISVDVSAKTESPQRKKEREFMAELDRVAVKQALDANVEAVIAAQAQHAELIAQREKKLRYDYEAMMQKNYPNILANAMGQVKRVGQVPALTKPWEKTGPAYMADVEMSQHLTVQIETLAATMCFQQNSRPWNMVSPDERKLWRRRAKEVCGEAEGVNNA